MTLITGPRQPLMRVSEDSQLVSAYVTLDSVSAPAPVPGTEFTIALYRFDKLGTPETAVLMALIDGDAPDATEWTALKPKLMPIVATVSLVAGDTVTMITPTPWTGALSMRFRRSS